MEGLLVVLNRAGQQWQSLKNIYGRAKLKEAKQSFLQHAT
jgi:hypothetical protein